MIAATDLKKGMVIELDGQLYAILDFQHIKMGRGSAQSQAQDEGYPGRAYHRAQLPVSGEIQSGADSS